MRRPDPARSTRLARALAFALAVLAAAAGSTPALAQDGRIRIGQSITLSGPGGEHGRAAATGARIYVDEVNASGGVAGRRIEIVTRDDGGEATRATANVRELIDKEQVVALLGGVEGGPCVATLKEASPRGVPLIGCMAGSPEMRDPPDRSSFPVRAGHVDEFARLLDIVRAYGYRRVAFLHADSDTGRRHLDNVRRLAGDRSIEVAAVAMTAGRAPEELARAIAAAKVDAVFNHGSHATYVAVIEALTARGDPPMFMAVNSGAAQMARALGPKAKGLVFTQVVPFPWAVAVPVVKEYQQALARHAPGTEPSFSGLEGYIGAKVLHAGLTAAGREATRSGIQRAMVSLGRLDLGGMEVRYGAGGYQGSRFVDTVIVASDGRFAR
ncbi:MAG: ABC transporter substrate-binding protein [Burkholderiales bacterium]